MKHTMFNKKRGKSLVILTLNTCKARSKQFTMHWVISGKTVTLLVRELETI